jgi:hypothetical protein
MGKSDWVIREQEKTPEGSCPSVVGKQQIQFKFAGNKWLKRNFPKVFSPSQGEMRITNVGLRKKTLNPTYPHG